MFQLLDTDPWYDIWYTVLLTDRASRLVRSISSHVVDNIIKEWSVYYTYVHVVSP